MEQHPDLLFLDVELPDIQGIRLLSEMRDEVLWDMKVVFYTAYDKYLLQALRVREAIRDMDRNRVRFCFFGDLSRLSPELRREAQEAVERSKKYEGVQVNFCLNYGGRDEIVRAAQRFAAQCAAGERRPEELTEDMFSDLLYSAGVPDPELVIRPGGETRISNFLLWQSAYAEYYFTDVLWPDFGPEELDKAIDAFNARDRRFGGVK